MTFWITAVLALFFLQSLLPASICYLGDRSKIGARLLVALGPRDNPPPMPTVGERAERALKNMFEALPIFLTFALLAIYHGRADGLALTGAQVFFVARLFYVPAYMSGVPYIRSALWTVGLVGLVMMVIPVVAP